MTEEDAFLDAIAADRADRTTLLVFADWLADRSDPREEFVRLHARLLKMDGTEADVGGLDMEWARWTGGVPFQWGFLPSAMPSPRLPEGWIDAFCRLFTVDEVAVFEEERRGTPGVGRLEFGQMDHICIAGEQSLVLYRGAAKSFRGPLDFVAYTVLDDLWDDPFTPTPAETVRYSEPISRVGFWSLWRAYIANLQNPPPVPEIGLDNPYLGGQMIEVDWNNWAIVAAHRDDYFALFWSTTA